MVEGADLEAEETKEERYEECLARGTRAFHLPPVAAMATSHLESVPQCTKGAAFLRPRAQETDIYVTSSSILDTYLYIQDAVHRPDDGDQYYFAIISPATIPTAKSGAP